MSIHGTGLSSAELEQRRRAPLRHGSTSEAQIRPLARNHRRRVLRQLRLSPRDLDPLARGYLDLYCRTIAKVELLDGYFAEHGLIRADGEPQPSTRFYTSLVNSARLALARLEEHLKTRSLGDPSMVLVLQAKAKRVEQAPS